MALMDIAILLISASIFAYFEFSSLISVTLFAIILTGLSFASTGSFLFLTVVWFLFLMMASFMLSAKLRRRFITNALISRVARKIPTISDTERAAIEAGDVWWEKELFSGRPDFEKLLSIPTAKLAPEEQAFLDGQTQTLCDMLDDWQVVGELHDLPQTIWNYLRNERFFGMIIPKEYGGLGFSALAHSSIITRIATKSFSAAISTMVPNSLGPAELLLHYGTDEQKSYYLPRLACGEEIPCFALTAPEAGSDAGAIPDTGMVCYGQHEGLKVLGIRLNWDKRYITLAPVATVIGVAIRLFDPDNLIGKGSSLGITLCLVPATHPGVESGRRHHPLYLGFMNGPTRGRDVFIPLDWVIGGAAMVGQGWHMLMECLSAGRGISLPALSTACGQLAYRMTGGYARVRRQFNMPISSFEGVSEALGQIAGLTYFLEACRILTATAVDQKIRPAIASAISKYHMTEMARRVIMHAMDIHGGHGIQAGPENYLANAHLGIPISITVEGANILTRNLIIFGQGAIRCHPYLLEEVDQFTAKPSLERSRKLDKLLFAHAGHAVSLVVRNIWCGLTGGRLLFSPERGKSAKYYRQLSRMSAAFALLSEVTLMLLGGELKRKERLSARLGDILSQLYLSSAVLKYFHDQGKPASDIPYVQWCLQHALVDIQNTIEDLTENYPSPVIGKVLRHVIFPWGRAYAKPSDSLHASITAAMLEPSPLRDRLTRLFHRPTTKKTATARVDAALLQVNRIEPILKKIHQALRSGEINPASSFEQQLHQAVRIHLLSEDEALSLTQYNNLYQDVIRVDEFSPDLSAVLTWEQPERKEEVV